MKNADNIQVSKEVYKPGERIEYTFSYCKDREGVAVVHRTLIDSIKIAFAEFNSSLPVGCKTVTVVDLIVPAFLTPSDELYHLEGTAIYKINPLRDQYVKWRSETFKIK